MRILFLLMLLAPGAARSGWSQKVLQIERYGRAKTQKLFLGAQLTYKMRNDEVWHTGYIDDLLIERNLIAFDDRYAPLDQIEAFRSYQPWAKAAGISLYTFGTAWSGLALIGTLTDNDPTTRYRASDAIVTATGIGLGWAVQKLFFRKTIRFGERRRLRMLDLTFQPPE